ncbi:MAG: PD-(D/E)XK nuclease family transposase, partial [Planctomyces sp.]
ATPVERWCWFLRHAQELTTEQLALLLPDQEFSEAAKVLDMIAQTPEQLQEYNARLKAQRDEEARIIHARQQGIEIGEARGETRGLRRGLLQGQILQLQQLLCLPTSTDAEFAACDQDQLSQILVRLQQRFKGEDV